MGDLGPQKAAELAVLMEKEVEQVGHLFVASATFPEERCDLGLPLRGLKEHEGLLRLLR